MRWPRWAVFSAAFAAALILMLGGAVLYVMENPVDLSDLREEIAAELQAATGREVRITGQIILGVSLRPELDVQGIEVKNMNWGRAKSFALIGGTKIRVHLFPLFQGRADIISIAAEHAEIHLETDGSARRNWSILAQAVTEDGEEAEIPEIEEITISDIIIDYRDIRDAELRHRLHLEKASLDYDTVNGIGHYRIAGTLGEETIKAEGKVAPLYTISPEQPRQFDMKAQLFGLTLSADGSAKFPFKEFTYADFTLESSKGLGQMAAYFGLGFPDLGAIKLAGNLTPFGDDLHFGNLTGNLGESGAQGFVVIRPGATLKITSEFRSDEIDAETYWNMLPSSTPPPGRLFGADPLKLELQENIELHLRYAVKSLKMGDHTFSNFLLDAKMDRNRLRFDHLDMDVAEGRLANSLVLTPRAGGMTLSQKSSASNVDLEKLLKQFDQPKYARGKLFALFEGESAGASMAQLAAGIDGRAYFELRDGSIPTRLSSLLSGGITNIFRSIEGMFDDTAKETGIDCAFGGFAVQNGVAENKVLLMLTKKAIVTGNGNIDLRTERWNMKLSPRPSDNRLISLASDVDIGGTFLAPEFGLNKASVARNVGKTALGMALGPFGMIFGMAGSVISRPGEKSEDKRCAITRTASFEALQRSAPWPELVQLGAAP